jgi:hypothetical protein
MPNEPDNPVLIQLHEIRATLAHHSVCFDRLERGLGDLRRLVSHALGLGTATEDQSGNSMSARTRRRCGTSVSTSVSDVERRRLTKVEQKLDS